MLSIELSIEYQELTTLLMYWWALPLLHIEDLGNEGVSSQRASVPGPTSVPMHLQRKLAGLLGQAVQPRAEHETSTCLWAQKEVGSEG